MKNLKNPITRAILLASFLMLAAAGMQAATHTVTKAQNTNDGVCDADCSLREAIDVSNAGDRVVFSSLFNTPQTIDVNPKLLISLNLTITGPGAELLTIFGNNSEAFEISSGIVNLSGMTIDSSTTIGFVNYGTTTVSECVFTDNEGAIINYAGTMTIRDSTITENIGFQPAVENRSEMTVSGSTFSNNLREGIVNDGGTLTVTNSTVSGNTGNGIENDAGTATITGSTVVYNPIGIEANGGTVTVRSTIVAGTAVINGRDIDQNFSGVIISGGYNLIGADTGYFTNLGDQTGTFITPLDPQIDPLGDYGGMTATHRLKTNSPAIDKAYSFGSATDQRDFLRPFDRANYPNATGGDGSDIGAYELQFAVFVAGGVFDSLGRPIKNTRVLLRAENGEQRVVKTDRFGGYRFDNVARNRNYQVGVANYRLEVVPQFWFITVTEENIGNLNFTVLP